MSAHQQIRPFLEAPRGEDVWETEATGLHSPQARAFEPAARGESSLTERAAPAYAELAEAIARRIRRQPLSSVALVLGVGFAVGGALTFRAGRIVLAAAARHVARELLKQVL